MLSVIRLTVRRARAVRFPAGANDAQAFGHGATGMGEISMPIPARGFSWGWRMILRLHPHGMKIIQPKVAKLPWVMVPMNLSTLNGLYYRTRNGDATALRLIFVLGRSPGIAAGASTPG
jgi:hypothetical protein